MANSWTADSTTVTADSATYTADGGNAANAPTLDPNTPSLAGYLLFLANVVGIPSAILNGNMSTAVLDSNGQPVYDSSGNPVTSSSGVNTQLMATVQMTLTVSQNIVSDLLNCASPLMYTYAVYNLAADRLINYANDSNGQTYFAKLREQFKIYSPTLGVPTSASDQGTSVGLLNPVFMQTFTLRDLQTLKTPYGRAYIEIAGDIGTLWGLS